jgi:hypothetical protein
MCWVSSAFASGLFSDETVARKARPYWLCRKCKYRNERIKRKCVSCGAAKPPRKVGKNQETLRDDDYAYYCRVAEVLHGVTDERCCVCGRPKPEGPRRFHHDREHDHNTGFPRGLACPPCNMLMKFRQLNAEKAQLIADYLKRAEKYPEHFTEKFTKPEDDLETKS